MRVWKCTKVGGHQGRRRGGVGGQCGQVAQVGGQKGHIGG